MNYEELSIKKLEDVDKCFFEKIISKYKYDLVIFIASGAYLIGEHLSQLNHVPLIEISAKREGGKIKKYFSFILKLIPKKIRLLLRKKELNSGVHENNTERKVYYDTEIWEKYKKCKNILLVDDSIDTGYSMDSCYSQIRKHFNKARVKIAALNYFEKSKKIIKCDFHIYKDTILIGPWSNDSRENKRHTKLYEEWKKKYVLGKLK